MQKTPAVRQTYITLYKGLGTPRKVLLKELHLPNLIKCPRCECKALKMSDWVEDTDGQFISYWGCRECEFYFSQRSNADIKSLITT